MNKKQVLAQFMKDSEMQPKPNRNDDGFDKIKLKLNDIEKCDNLFCPLCKSRRIWKVRLDFEHNGCGIAPEWTYICSTCEHKIIMVFEGCD